MEIISSVSAPFHGTLKRYWRRRRYQRLHNEITNKKNVKIARFGGNTRKSWKIRVIPKLRLKILSPIKLFARFRDAYVNMMLSLSNNVHRSGNSRDLFVGKRIPMSRDVPSVAPSEEFERKLLFEIYRALVATRELAAY